MEEEVKSVENYVLIAGIVACVVGAIVASTGGEDPTRVIYVPYIEHFLGVKVPLLVIEGGNGGNSAPAWAVPMEILGWMAVLGVIGWKVFKVFRNRKR